MASPAKPKTITIFYQYDGAKRPFRDRDPNEKMKVTMQGFIAGGHMVGDKPLLFYRWMFDGDRVNPEDTVGEIFGNSDDEENLVIVALERTGG